MAERTSHATARPLPELAILLSTLLWGTLWVPVRGLHGASDNGAWATSLGFLLPLLVLLPAALAGWQRTPGGLRSCTAAGFWLALGIALYAEGVARGQVARVVLLFYLTPVWSIVLARIALQQPITHRRLATIALGLAGMLVIFAGGGGSGSGVSLADGMGLAGGIAWAIALVAANRNASPTSFERVVAQFLFLAPVYFLVASLPGAESAGATGSPGAADALPWLLAFSLLWMLPVVWLTVFAAARLEPGRFAILLMFEIVVGIASATLLANEPLGAREIAGALLVLGAIGVEIQIGPGA
ncbi:MAG: DMT family transporter [Deltaproteobacteria bacterium]|nr:DMT family transporter [Deltaproteobacteria bacterium]